MPNRAIAVSCPPFVSLLEAAPVQQTCQRVNFRFIAEPPLACRLPPLSFDESTENRRSQEVETNTEEADIRQQPCAEIRGKQHGA